MDRIFQLLNSTSHSPYLVGGYHTFLFWKILNFLYHSEIGISFKTFTREPFLFKYQNIHLLAKDTELVLIIFAATIFKINGPNIFNQIAKILKF